MAASDSIENLISVFAKDMSDEDLILSAIQGLIASEITGYRIKHHMTQTELAQLLGVSQGMLSKWESGDCNFRLSTLVSISSKLGIEMQSPFIPAAPKVYQTRHSNITQLPQVSWSSRSYFEKPSFSASITPEQELFEM